MEKLKLMNLRKAKGLSQEQMADQLSITVSTYCRKESGQIKIRQDEWERISKFLDIPIEDVMETEDAHYFIIKDNATANYLGTNHVYSIPEHLLDTQRKYIDKLENELTNSRKETETLNEQIRKMKLEINTIKAKLV